MNPEDLFDLASAYTDGEMSIEESISFESELAASTELSQELLEISELRGLLRANGKEEMPAGMLNLIIAVVGSADEDPSAVSYEPGLGEPAAGVSAIGERATTQRRLAKWFAGVAAAACLLVVVGMPSRGSVAPPIAASVETHAARSSLDEPAIEKLSAASVSAGFLR
jgi:anti-sigma factor RsiW